MANPFSDAAFHPNPEHSTQNRYVPVSLLNIISNSKLPRIDKHRQVDDETKKFNYRSSVKSSTKLPTLKPDNSNLQIQSKIKQTIISNSHGLMSRGSKRQKSEGDDFLTEIQKKLKIVLQGQNTDNYGQPSDSDEDFERKVNKNKQKIKKQRLRRQAQNQSLIEQSTQNFLSPNNNTNNITTNHHTLENKKKQSNNSHQNLHKIVANMNKNRQRIDAIYQKRVKDYKEQSIGNKILMKKKQLAQRQLVKKSPHNQGQQQVGTSVNYKSVKNRPIKNNSSRNTKKQGGQHVSLTQKDQDLFDNIHNILLNLNRKSQNDMMKQRSKQKIKQREKQKQKDKPKKTKQQMQNQIRGLELKLAEQRRQDLLLLSKLQINRKKEKNKYELQATQATINGHNLQENALSWRKVETSGTNLQVKRSNFQEQLQRINKYFEKNERSLQKYVQNQRKIVNLNQIRRRNEIQSHKVNA